MTGSTRVPGELSHEILLDDIDSPILQQGYAYWRGLCHDRKFPSRKDVTPRGLAGLLRHTELLRVIDGGKDYEYRIVGDAYVLAHGVSFQGICWSETRSFTPDGYKIIKSIYDTIVQTGEPLAKCGWIERGGKNSELIYSEYLFLPLGEDDKMVDHILVFAVYVSNETIDKSM